MADAWGMLDELLADERDRMTAWEVTFIESLAEQRTRALSRNHDWRPTEKQVHTLGTIWFTVFGG